MVETQNVKVENLPKVANAPSASSLALPHSQHTNEQEQRNELVIKLTENFTKILSTTQLINNGLYWGGNGVGDRWENKKFNYTSISLKGCRLYSENEDDTIPQIILDEFLQKTHDNKTGIIGIFVHSNRQNIERRPINKKCREIITKRSCVVCGTHKTIVDHKNDLYNDTRVLSLYTQLLSDFQPLCNHCNLQKRQVCNVEKKNHKLFSAKSIERYKIYPFEFPWEKKTFDTNDIYCKNETYWFDPVEFDRKIYHYLLYVVPILNEIKRHHKVNRIPVIGL